MSPVMITLQNSESNNGETTKLILSNLQSVQVAWTPKMLCDSLTSLRKLHQDFCPSELHEFVTFVFLFLLFALVRRPLFILVRSSLVMIFVLLSFLLAPKIDLFRLLFSFQIELHVSERDSVFSLSASISLYEVINLVSSSMILYYPHFLLFFERLTITLSHSC